MQQEFLKKITRHILNNTSFVVIETDTIDGAYKLFRSVNARGAPLSQLNIVRAELLGSNDIAATEVAKEWDAVEDIVGEEELDNYMSTVISSVHPGNVEGEAHRLRQILQAPNLRVEFLSRMRSFLRAYIALEDNSSGLGDFPLATQRTIACVDALPFDDWKPAAHMLLAHSPKSNYIDRFFRAIDALGLMMLLTKMSANQRKNRFKKITDAIINGEDPHPPENL